MARGFYSVVQYCPDRFRAEAVNVGLVLLCTDPHAVRVRMTNNHDRVRKLFGVARPELKNLKVSTHGLTSRIENSADDFRTSEDLSAFAAQRANNLRLTEPRLAKLDDIDADFQRLFEQLVEQRSTVDRAAASPAEVLPPRLGEVFHRLAQQRKIWDPEAIRVPISNRKLDVPYAYKNGVVNLVKPHVFNPGKRGENQAAMLALDGDLINKHLVGGEQHKLIIVSTQEDDNQAKEVSEHVAPLFREYDVRLIRPSDFDSFAIEVERNAH